MAEVGNYASENVNKILVGNKCDLETDRQVIYDEGKDYADRLGIKFIEASTKESMNVDGAFNTMINEIMAKVQKNDAEVAKDVKSS